MQDTTHDRTDWEPGDGLPLEAARAGAFAGTVGAALTVLLVGTMWLGAHDAGLLQVLLLFIGGAAVASSAAIAGLAIGTAVGFLLRVSGPDQGRALLASADRVGALLAAIAGLCSAAVVQGIITMPIAEAIGVTVAATGSGAVAGASAGRWLAARTSRSTTCRIT